jgi:GT2 family glycosyltransferase
MKLLIVILNYNCSSLTIDCLKTLEKEVAHDPQIRVAICENGSAPQEEVRLRQVIAEQGWGHWVEMTAITPNRGFCGGNNAIIRQWQGRPDEPDHYLLLNSDTLVHPDSMHALLRFMEDHPRAGVAGSKLTRLSGERDGTPFRHPSIVSEFEKGLRLGAFSRLVRDSSVTLHPLPETETQVDWVSGASIIIRKEVMSQVGLLDEKLYTYFDDVDYCLNCRRAGWEVWYVPQSWVTHINGATTGVTTRILKRRPDYLFQARRRFWLKNHGALYTALVDAAFLTGFALWRLRRRLTGKPDQDPPYFLWDSLRHSVFFTGFELREVENPALKATAQQGAVKP